MPHVYIITDVIDSFVHLSIFHSYFVLLIKHLVRCDIVSASKILYTRKTSNIRHTIVGNKIVYHSDAVGASPVGAALITSSISA